MPFVALDLETTWLEHSKDKIIEIAIVKFDEKTFEILDTFTSLVNPGIHIPELNANITGITDETIKEAPFFSEIIEQVQNFIADAPIVWHNIQFDIRFLTSNGVNLQNNRFIDTFFLANAFLSSESSLSLESLCYYFGVPLLEAHRALHDTKASVLVFQKLGGYFLDSLSQEEKVLFHYALWASSNTQIVFLKDFFFPQIPEPQFETIKKIILKKVDFYKPRTQLKVKKVPSVENCFKKLSSMEKRDNQLSLVSLIEENFKTNKKSVIEASTGIGKTLAYCLPALRHSLLTGEQIFISTKSKIFTIPFDSIFHM